MEKKIVSYLAILVAAVFFWIAYVYFTHQAQDLPSYFPGHEAGLATVHTKHGLAAVVVGLACLVYAWFGMGPKNKTESSSESAE